MSSEVPLTGWVVREDDLGRGFYAMHPETGDILHKDGRCEFTAREDAFYDSREECDRCTKIFLHAYANGLAVVLERTICNDELENMRL